MSDEYISKLNAWNAFECALKRLNHHIANHEALLLQLGASTERLSLQSDWDAVHAASDMIRAGYDGYCTIELIWAGTEYVYLFHRCGERLGVM